MGMDRTSSRLRDSTLKWEVHYETRCSNVHHIRNTEHNSSVRIRLGIRHRPRRPNCSIWNLDLRSYSRCEFYQWGTSRQPLDYSLELHDSQSRNLHVSVQELGQHNKHSHEYFRNQVHIHNRHRGPFLGSPLHLSRILDLLHNRRHWSLLHCHRNHCLFCLRRDHSRMELCSGAQQFSDSRQFSHQRIR